ncbi:MAG: hypothetical protein NW205_10285 [Hyphomicrobiaceae bacterium]|nr:hypothetical protein [Hyphomicrobiaceae bacterium]
MTDIAIIYPHMRDELIRNLEKFPKYMDHAWASTTSEKEKLFALDIAEDFFSDMFDERSPETWIGKMLVSRDEVIAIDRFISALKKFRETHGYELSPNRFNEIPEWSIVLTSAKDALSIINKER